MLYDSSVALQRCKRWRRIRVPLTWAHACPEQGHVVLAAEQMGVYVTDRFGRLYRMKKKGTRFVADGDAGCPWCGELPPDLAASLGR